MFAIDDSETQSECTRLICCPESPNVEFCESVLFPSDANDAVDVDSLISLTNEASETINSHAFCDLLVSANLLGAEYDSIQQQIDACIVRRSFENDKRRRFETEIELIELTERSGNVFLNIDSRLYASYFNNIIGNGSMAFKIQQFRILLPVLRSFYAKDYHRVTAYNNLCYCLHKCSDDANAELWAKLAIESYPSALILWSDLCVALKAQRKFAELFDAKLKRDELKKLETSKLDLKRLISPFSKKKFTTH